MLCKYSDIILDTEKYSSDIRVKLSQNVSIIRILVMGFEAVVDCGSVKLDEIFILSVA